MNKLFEFVLGSFAFGLIACGALLAVILIIALSLPFKRKR